MRTLLVNVADVEGGAARVTQRLHSEFLRGGIDSRYMVQFARTDDPRLLSPSGKLGKLAARLRPELDSLPLAAYPRATGSLFSPSIIPDGLRRMIRRVNPNIVHLNWICKGFVRVETVGRIEKPVVWTFHDSWGFTGGCHVPFDCLRYREGCGRCPQLSSARAADLSRRVYRRKSRAYRKAGLTVVCPSTWLASCARSSPLLAGTRIEVIPNGIDTEVFKPLDKAVARRIFGLPPAARIVLFGAMGAVTDRNKGFRELTEALSRFSRDWSRGEVLLVVFGSAEPREQPHFGVPTRYVGRLFDDVSLSVLYSAADVFVAPSRQENLPTTVMEAMACGTPTVAFNSSGFPDLVDHEQSGFLAAAYDPADFARGIAWVLADPLRSRSLGSAARKRVEERFRIEDVARRYLMLYRELTGQPAENED